MMVVNCWSCGTQRWEGIGPCGTCDAPAEPSESPTPPLGLTSIRDLLTDEEQAELDADLVRMAQQRRRAEAEAANIWLA